MMRAAEIRAAAVGLRAQLAAIDSGEIEATTAERAFIAGTLHGLQLVTGDASAEPTTHERPDRGHA